MNDTLQRISDKLEEKGVSGNQMCKDIGLSWSTYAGWKKYNKIPSSQWLQPIADYLDVPVEYLLIGDSEGYYMDRTTARYAQALVDRPEMKILFDAAEDASREVLMSVITLLEASKRK